LSVSGILMIFVPLVVIMDPIGGVPFFLLFTEDMSSGEQRRTAATACLGALAILGLFAYTGDMILNFFGVELGAFQIAGGIVFLVYALQMLQLVPGAIKSTEPEREESRHRDRVGLVPLATPLFAGPGAITAVLVWGRGPGAAGPSLALLVAILAACLAVFFTLLFARGLRRLLGVSGIRLATRLMGLLLAVLAVQYVVDGLRAVLCIV